MSQARERRWAEFHAAGRSRSPESAEARANRAAAAVIREAKLRIARDLASALGLLE